MQLESKPNFNDLFKHEKPITTPYSNLLSSKSLIGILSLVSDHLVSSKLKSSDKIKKQASELGIIYSIKRKRVHSCILNEILSMRSETGLEGRPIILVPRIEEDGNLCIYNSQSFLSEAKYVSPIIAKKKYAHSHGNELLNKIYFKRLVREREVIFEVRDNVEKRHWNRVIASFLLGPEWQFKDWPVSEKPVSLFAKIRGFYLKYQEQESHPNITTWNVKTLQINRERRYLDHGAQTEFWRELEGFICLERMKK